MLERYKSGEESCSVSVGELPRTLIKNNKVKVACKRAKLATNWTRSNNTASNGVEMKRDVAQVTRLFRASSSSTQIRLQTTTKLFWQGVDDTKKNKEKKKNYMVCSSRPV